MTKIMSQGFRGKTAKFHFDLHLLKAESEGTRIIPLIAKPCRFTREKGLSEFQAINDPKKPLINLSEGKQEEVYDNISEIVESLMGQ